MIPDIVLAHYAERAYKQHTIKGDTTEVLIKRRGSAKIIAFRGSDTLDDVRVNLSFFPTYSRSCGFTHRGYLKAVRGIIFDVMSYIDKTEPVYIVGHSKGAAEGLILARKLQVAGFNVVKVLLIGSPKVCAFSTRAYRDLTIALYSNDGDAVDNLPPAPWWKHPREVIKLDAKGHSLRQSIKALAGARDGGSG